MDENRVGNRHPVVREYRTASRSALDAEPARSFRSLSKASTVTRLLLLNWTRRLSIASSRECSLSELGTPLNCSNISDFDLGIRYRKANALLEFFRSHYAEILYLAGDMVDGWNSGRYWCWGPAQNAAAREIVNWGWRNARLLILPGGGDRRVRFELERRSLRTYLKRLLSKATNCLTATRFNEVRL